jgi:Ca-activated chloride channel family protein
MGSKRLPVYAFPVRHRSIALAVTAAAALTALADLPAVAPAKAWAGAGQVVFRGGVDLVNVTATVTDGDGRFISGLTKENFVIYDDGKRQEIVTFSSERVPVSLGMLLDISGSMTEDRLATARAAIHHFIFDLLAKDDELFLMEFAGRSRMLQTWTRDRDTLNRALGRARRSTGQFGGRPRPGRVGNNGTAVFDTVAASLPLAAEGVHQKKAVLILSDGKDTSSRLSVRDAQEAIRRSEVLVYALAVEGAERGPAGSLADGRVDARALRRLTDDTGGRTEVVKGFRNLEEATARLADELNQQYTIGYAAPASRDGKWHAIKVEVVKKRGAKVRARAGYVASRPS